MVEVDEESGPQETEKKKKEKNDEAWVLHESCTYGSFSGTE